MFGTVRAGTRRTCVVTAEKESFHSYAAGQQKGGRELRTQRESSKIALRCVRLIFLYFSRERKVYGALQREIEIRRLKRVLIRSREIPTLNTFVGTGQSGRKRIRLGK